jgi:hypothetical protein
MKDLTIKAILLKQLQLLQEECERDITPYEAARLSAALAEALVIAGEHTPTVPLSL